MTGQNSDTASVAAAEDKADAPTAFEEEGAAYSATGADAAGGAPPRGLEVIQAHVKTLPDAPGVYRMLDADGAVLYVGKARSLKKRVASYAKTAGHTNRILRMILSTASMVFVTTKTDTEALLLEANLIKRLNRATMCCCATTRASRRS